MISSSLISVMPRWTQELHRFLGLKSLFFIHGNIYDCYYYPLNIDTATAPEQLEYLLKNSLGDSYLKDLFFSEGYSYVICYDAVDGFSIWDRQGKQPFATALKAIGIEDARNPQNYLESDAIDLMRRVMANNQQLCACIFSFGSRLTSEPNHLSEKERPLFMKMMKLAGETKPFRNSDNLRNCLVLILDNISDVPAWLLLNNPFARAIEVTKPNKEERRLYYKAQASLFYQTPVTEAPDSNLEATFLDYTDGLSNRELENLRAISLREQLPLSEIKKIVDLYKYGTRENFWEKLEKAKIEQAETELKKRVKGQDEAIKRTVEIIRRAKMGLDGIDQNKLKSKPKGVLFFAGPTGVGKTELAKSIAELIFNNEDAIIRFDMSEYNDSNSDVKLIGAPPGYVGYEEGGQLTNRVKERPFSIILFDEIEKAHPKVFDKFLQILDDGRLTDSQGNTVYFSESLIIFTSNLGIFKLNERNERIPNVHYHPQFPDNKELNDTYGEMKDKIQAEIDRFFNSQLNRPEIRNRFGENFVVFDFIRPPHDADIVKMKLKTISRNIKKKCNCELIFSEEFIAAFRTHFVLEKLADGGRGINNRIEKMIVNSLTEHLYTRDSWENSTITATITINEHKQPILEYQ